MAVIKDNNINLSTDIGQVLNAAGGSVNTNQPVTYFSESAKINKYSKYKPVRHVNLFRLNDALYKEANYGYRIPDPVNLNTYVNGVRGTSIPSQWAKPDNASYEIQHGWYYQLPTGGNSQPYRLSDFIGYNTDVRKSLFGEVLAPAQINQNTTSMYVSLDTGTFALSDFSHFNNMHIGVLIVGDGVQKYKSILSSESTSSQYRIDFSKDEMTNIFGSKYGTYDVYVFATATNGQNISNSMNYYQTNLTDIYPLPVNSCKINYVYTGATTYFTFSVIEMEAEERTVYFAIRATNTTSESRSVTPNALKAKVTAYNDDGTWSDSSERALNNSSVSVPAKSSVIVGTFQLSYSAYRELAFPWWVQVDIYYPNSEGVSTYAGTGSVYYEG